MESKKRYLKYYSILYTYILCNILRHMTLPFVALSYMYRSVDNSKCHLIWVQVLLATTNNDMQKTLLCELFCCKPLFYSAQFSKDHWIIT